MCVGASSWPGIRDSEDEFAAAYKNFGTEIKKFFPTERFVVCTRKKYVVRASAG